MYFLRSKLVLTDTVDVMALFNLDWCLCLFDVNDIDIRKRVTNVTITSQWAIGMHNIGKKTLTFFENLYLERINHTRNGVILCGIEFA